MSQVLIGIEMGGTSCKIAAFNLDNTLIEKTSVKTSGSDYKVTLNEMSEWISSKFSDIKAIGIACFGPVCLDKTSEKYGCVTTTPKLAWQGAPVYKHFTQTHGFADKPDMVFIDTDVNVCALYGYQLAKAAGSVKESFCYITVGTGVGVGLIVNEKCVHGTLHPEGGHVFVPRDARDKDFKGVCPFHNDCVEGMATNVSIKERLGLESVEDVAKIDDSHEVWDIVGGYLGTMCSNIFLTTSVEMIMLGGGVFNREMLIGKSRDAFTARVNKYLVHDKISSEEAMKKFMVRPEHGDDLGLYASGFVASNL